MVVEDTKVRGQLCMCRGCSASKVVLTAGTYAAAVPRVRAVVISL